MFPELAVNGYPPEDLLLKTHFLAAGRRALDEIAQHVARHGRAGGLRRARRGRLQLASRCSRTARSAAIYRKMFLPNYGVFDEQRYFQVGDTPAVVRVNGTTIGLTICEDIWEPGPPASDEALAGAEVIVNISASPYHRGKGAERERMLIQRARDSLAYVVFCNLVGGQDELVFDGYSLVIDQDGELMARGAQFEEELIVCDIDPSTAERRPPARRPPPARGADAPPRRRRPRRGSRRPPHHDSDRGRRPAREAARARRGGVRGAVPGPARLRRQERVRAACCSGSPAASTPRSRPASRSTRSARTACAARSCPPPTPRAETQQDARTLADNLGIERYEFELEPLMRDYEQTLARGVRGHRAGRGRGEHPGAHPRQPADGALQQVRLARAHDRQQERVLGRLRDALRRHGGRLRRAEGRAEDARLPARPLPQQRAASP